MLISKSREELIELANEYGLKISFDNPPEKVGFWNGDKRLTFKDIFAPFFNGVLPMKEENEVITKENVEVQANERIKWIQTILENAQANGIILGLSGGKDSAVVGALVKQATPNVLGVILPCGNIDEDEHLAWKLAEAFNIETVKVDIKEPFDALVKNFQPILDTTGLTGLALSNIKPRLRMTTLYAIGQEKGYLVAGTGNKSEGTVGYFTKWGDGGHDFNPIADLTVQEVLILGDYLNVPKEILYRVPSAGLWEGQTDEDEMGVTYKEIDEFILTGSTNQRATAIIQDRYVKSQHKRDKPYTFN